MRDVERFLLMVSSKMLPHDHYSLLAYQLGISMMNATSKMSLCLTESLPSIMWLKKLNAFARSSNLNKRQSLHIDGEDLGLTVIVVYSCGSDGYPIYYVLKSHNLMHQHIVSKPIPSSAVLRVTAQKGDVIIFADSLIHGGGSPVCQRTHLMMSCVISLVHVGKPTTLPFTQVNRKRIMKICMVGTQKNQHGKCTKVGLDLEVILANNRRMYHYSIHSLTMEAQVRCQLGWGEISGMKSMTAN